MNLIISWLVFALTIYQWVIAACIIISFFPEFQNNEFARFLSQLVDPYVAIFRKFIPPIGGWDFSALVAIITINLAIRGLRGW